MSEHSPSTLQTGVAILVAIVVYFVVATILTPLAFYLYEATAPNFARRYPEFLKCVIGAVAGVYAAKYTCDAALRGYSSKAICVAFELMAGALLTLIIISWSYPATSNLDWSDIYPATRDICCAIAAVFAFWNAPEKLTASELPT